MDVTTVVFRTVLGVVTAYHIITLLLWILIITLYMQAQHFEWLSKGMENGALDELLRQLHTQVPFQPSSTVATDESPPPRLIPLAYLHLRMVMILRPHHSYPTHLLLRPLR